MSVPRAHCGWEEQVPVVTHQPQEGSTKQADKQDGKPELHLK
jgi:hypothetical protein